MPSSLSIRALSASRRAQRFAFAQAASTRTRVLSVSSNVRLPELPDARMDTRMPIGASVTAVEYNNTKRSLMMANAKLRVNTITGTARRNEHYPAAQFQQRH